MKTAAIILFFALCCSRTAPAQELTRVAIARHPVPVFNTARSAQPDTLLKPDRCGQVRQLEFIALPGTVFDIVATPSNSPAVLQVRTPDYQPPPGTRLYISAELLTPQPTTPSQRNPRLPEPSKIIQQLRSAVGLPYVWGGNLRSGVTRAGQLQFVGLDCSGLLYEATDGYTPRNTEQLVTFGNPVAIEGKNIHALMQQLRPLDLIVWKGHVIIILNHKTVVESILTCDGSRDGVVTTPLKIRLEQLLKQRSPLNNWPPGVGKSAHFVVRRWI